MKRPMLKQINCEQFLNEAFDSEHHNKWEREAHLRRNIYLGLFISGFACVFITALMGQLTLSILSLFLSTTSLVVMTKYDTQLFFLRILKKREQQHDADVQS